MNTAVLDRLSQRDRDAEEGSLRTLLHWILCFVVIVVLHAGAAWIATHRQPADEPRSSSPAAVMIDLAPLPAAPPPPPSEIPPGPAQEAAQPPMPEAAAQPNVSPAPPVPEEVVQPVLPFAPATPSPKIDVPLPPPPKPKPPTRAAHTVLREPPKVQPDNKPYAPETTALPAVQASPVPTVAAPAPGSAMAPASNAVPTWQGLLVARLEQFKRYPISAQFRHQQGVAYVRFTMNRYGKVLSAQIQKSSGFDALDDETLALIHRAEPLPAPPSSFPGDPLELVVPIEFFLAGRR